MKMPDFIFIAEGPLSPAYMAILLEVLVWPPTVMHIVRSQKRVTDLL